MTAPVEIDLMGARSAAVVKSAAFTAAPADTDLVGFRDIAGIAVTLSVTAITTAASVLVQVLGVDSTSGTTFPIGSMVALTAVGETTLRIHPANPTAVDTGGVQVQQGQIPPRVRIHVVQGNANPTTYSVGVECTS